MTDDFWDIIVLIFFDDNNESNFSSLEIKSKNDSFLFLFPEIWDLPIFRYIHQYL